MLQALQKQNKKNIFLNIFIFHFSVSISILQCDQKKKLFPHL